MKDLTNVEGFWEGLRRGLSMIPISTQSKRPLLRHDVDEEGNSVGTVEADTAGWKPYQKIRADEETIRRWLRKWPDANPAFVTGQVSGIDVLDIDSIDAHRWISQGGYKRLFGRTTGEKSGSQRIATPFQLFPTKCALGRRQHQGEKAHASGL
jgi:hypothetical protein